MRKDKFYLWDEEQDKEVLTEVTLYSKQEIIDLMRDKKHSEYSMELFAPRCFKYTEDLLDDDSEYYFDGKVITVVLQ